MKRPEIEKILDREHTIVAHAGKWDEAAHDLIDLCKYVLYLEDEGRKIVGLLIPAQTLTGSGAITTTLDQEGT